MGTFPALPFDPLNMFHGSLFYLKLLSSLIKNDTSFLDAIAYTCWRVWIEISFIAVSFLFLPTALMLHLFSSLFVVS